VHFGEGRGALAEKVKDKKGNGNNTILSTKYKQ